MKAGWMLAALLLSSAELQAITWEFDEEGNAQGWVAREGKLSGGAEAFLSPLSSEVADGVWRIQPVTYASGRSPSIQLISPQLGDDSSLFDRLVLRLRLVQARPVQGRIQLTWTNATNRNYPGEPPSSNPFECGELCNSFFTTTPYETFTTDWQEITIGDLRSGAVIEPDGYSHDILWEGELIDIRVECVLSRDPVESADDWPQALEVDWIRLTGVEEQLQGERTPPAVHAPSGSGEQFEFVAFSPVSRRGLGASSNPFAAPAVLGDVDGDGDLDLVTSTWQAKDQAGWVVVFNEGGGYFAHPQDGTFAVDWKRPPHLDGADLDADGLLDLMLAPIGSGYHTYLLQNQAESGWMLAQEFSLWPIGLGDADGDGAADLWLQEASQEGTYHLLLDRNDGIGRFAEPRRIALDTSRPFVPTRWVHHLRQGKVVGVLWQPPAEEPGLGYKVTYLDTQGEVVRASLATEVSWDRVRYAGDVDGDGDVDLVVSDAFYLQRRQSYYRGLTLLRNRGEGDFDALSWLPDVILHQYSQQVLFVDLNADGRLDPVVVDSNERHPAIIVGRGSSQGLPVEEGRYPFEGVGGTVLGGDVDGDGDVDLVWVEAAFGQEGVHVLRNRGRDSRTVVMEGKGASMPVRFRLAPNYPNPFNPQTWIPFELPEESDFVDLRIYNVLGQPIRTLVAGRLGAGYHLMPWDGRDSQGQAVSAGMYLYRLQTGDGQITRKMLKVE